LKFAAMVSRALGCFFKERPFAAGMRPGPFLSHGDGQHFGLSGSMMKRDGAPHKLQRFVLHVGGDEFERVTSGGLPIALNEAVICQLARILGDTRLDQLGQVLTEPGATHSGHQQQFSFALGAIMRLLRCANEQYRSSSNP